MREPPGARPSAKPTRVLLVDDDPQDAALFGSMLVAAGPGGAFEVAHADRFSTAVRHLSRERTDVVLVSLPLPGAHEFRGVGGLCGSYPELPIVVLAGFEDEVQGLRAIREGAQEYLVKGEVDRRLLARAIRYAIGRKRAQREAMLATLDRFPDGVLLLDEEGRVSLVNRAAEELLAEGDGLSLDQGFLRTGSVPATARLREAIRVATHTSSRSSSLPVDSVSVARSSRRRPLLLTVVPIRARDLRQVERRNPAVVFVGAREKPIPSTDTRLTGRYGLTSAEGRLMGELMQGHSLETATERLGINIDMARSQLERILDKSDAGRQGELIQMLVAGSTSIR